MGKGRSLTEFEKKKILGPRNDKKTITEISKEIERSRGVIYNFLGNPEKYGSKKHTGRPKKLGEKTRKRIIQLAKGKNVTANNLKAKLNLSVHKSTILRILKDEGGLKRKKIKRKPALNDIHKRNRLLFAGKYANLKEKWQNVVFSDEKKFNLDGPDGYNYYWAGLNTKELGYPRRSMGGPSLMVWGCFNYNKKSKLAIIKENIDSKKYQEVLSNYLIPFLQGFNRNDVIFQQDNAKPHVSASTRNWLEANNIKTMEWPALSPDLNLIENAWGGELVRSVYSNGKTYTDLKELEKSILQNWENISQRYLKKLVDSMETRIQKVIDNFGGSTKY